MNPLSRLDDTVDQLVRPLQRRPGVGVAVWAVGTACELVLLAGLFNDAIRKRNPATASRLAAPIAAERLIVHGLGPLIDRDRPASRLRRPANLSPSSSSLPSGHASNAFLAATLLARRRSSLAAYLLAGAVATSRILLRVHRVSDVAISIVTGVAIGRLMNHAIPS